jgi:hypothetical protein
VAEETEKSSAASDTAKPAIVGIEISQEHGYPIGAIMAEELTPDKISLEELMVSTLAMTDALAKLMIAKGIITDEEFKAQLSAERANYLAVLKRLH